MQDFRIALVVPLFQGAGYFNNPVEYLGFGYIAAYLRQYGFHVDIIDAYTENLNCEQAARRLEDGGYQLIGFTIMSSDYFKNMQYILDKLSDKILYESHMTVGGYYPTFHKDKLLHLERRIDSLIIGEGEITFLELAKQLLSKQGLENIRGLIYKREGQILQNPLRPLMSEAELDRLPLPSRETLSKVLESGGDARVFSSRGCYGSCTFCGVRQFYGSLEGAKWRGRSPESVVLEIEWLIENYDIKYLYFIDEEFIGPGQKGQQRAQAIARCMIEKKIHIPFCIYCRVNSVTKETFLLLKEAGLDRVFLGVEFGVQKILDFYGKNVAVEENAKALHILEQLQIQISVGYILFEPLMDIADFRENLKFYVENTPLHLRILLSKMAIYHDSAAYHKLKDEIKLADTPTFDRLLGDHYEYEFKDEKIAFLYRLLCDCLPVISPSKGYRQVVNKLLEEKRPQALKIWQKELYEHIDGLALKLLEEKDLSPKNNYEAYRQWFRHNLMQWDTQFSEELYRYIDKEEKKAFMC